MTYEQRKYLAVAMDNLDSAITKALEDSKEKNVDIHIDQRRSDIYNALDNFYDECIGEGLIDMEETYL